MKSRYIVDKFFEHLEREAEKGHARMLAAGEPCMVLFGTDEFRVDRKNGAILLPDYGWVKCPDIKSTSGVFDWVGVINDVEGWCAVLGRGNPYQSETPAVPYALHKAVETDVAKRPVR